MKCRESVKRTLAESNEMLEVWTSFVTLESIPTSTDQ